MPKIPNVQNSMFSPQKRQKAEDGGWWVEKMQNKPNYFVLSSALCVLRKKMENKANFNVSSFLTSKYVGYFKVAVKKSKANPSKGSGQVCQINRFFCKFLPL